MWKVINMKFLAKAVVQRESYEFYICVLRLPLLVHPSCTCIAYCKFQSTSSMEGRLFWSLPRQVSAISTAVFNDWNAYEPCMLDSTTFLKFDSAMPLSSCEERNNNKRSQCYSCNERKSLRKNFGLWWTKADTPSFISFSSAGDLTSFPVMTSSRMIPSW